MIKERKFIPYLDLDLVLVQYPVFTFGLPVSTVVSRSMARALCLTAAVQDLMLPALM
jgi:hypothetical protein